MCTGCEAISARSRPETRTRPYVATSIMRLCRVAEGIPTPAAAACASVGTNWAICHPTVWRFTLIQLDPTVGTTWTTPPWTGDSLILVILREVSF